MDDRRDDTARDADRPRRADYAPTGAGEKTGLFATLRRVATEFSEDNLSDWAAALTYYALLSLFPALIAMVAVLGLVGDPQTITSNITEIVTKLGPKSAAQTFSGPIKSITQNKGGSLIVLIVGCALAHKDVHWMETVLLSIFVTAGAVAIFVYGLGMPYRLFWWSN